MQTLDTLLRQNLGKVFTAAAVEIRHRGGVIYRATFGSTRPEGQLDGPPVRRDTLFDFASLTKLFTASAFFRIVDAGHIMLDAPLVSVLPEFGGTRPIQPYDHPLNTGEKVEVVPPTDELIDASSVTFRHILSHSAGLPAWINLRNGSDVAARRAMCLQASFAYPPGTRVVYSDVGFILLGLAIERLTDSPLNAAVKRLVTRPLDLSIRYGPITDHDVAPTEFDPWRGRRIQGEVHDENAATLDGIAGHAGLFGTATDAALLGQIYLADGGGFLSPRLVREAARRQIEDRGLGWMMRSSQGSSSGQHFSPESYGHTGFVGNSLWVDPARQLVVALLTNNVFFGRDKLNIMEFRPTFHDAVINALERT